MNLIVIVMTICQEQHMQLGNLLLETMVAGNRPAQLITGVLEME
jgi:hypothetical protein